MVVNATVTLCTMTQCTYMIFGSGCFVIFFLFLFQSLTQKIAQLLSFDWTEKVGEEHSWKRVAICWQYFCSNAWISCKLGWEGDTWKTWRECAQRSKFSLSTSLFIFFLLVSLSFSNGLALAPQFPPGKTSLSSSNTSLAWTSGNWKKLRDRGEAGLLSWSGAASKQSGGSSWDIVQGRGALIFFRCASISSTYCP